MEGTSEWSQLSTEEGKATSELLAGISYEGKMTIFSENLITIYLQNLYVQ